MRCFRYRFAPHVPGWRPCVPWSACLGLTLIAAGCTGGPEYSRGLHMVKQLAESQWQLSSSFGTPPGTACDAGGEVRGKLFSEPEPPGARGAWPALLRASEALMAACGRMNLLQLPDSVPSAAGRLARQRWSDAAQADLRETCVALREAALHLRGAPPQCLA